MVRGGSERCGGFMVASDNLVDFEWDSTPSAGEVQSPKTGAVFCEIELQPWLGQLFGREEAGLPYRGHGASGRMTGLRVQRPAFWFSV